MTASAQSGASYQHTQVGYLMLAVLGAGIAGAVYAAAVTGAGGPLAVAGILAGAFLLFATLTTRVRDGRVVVSFGPGLIRRRISLDDIREVRVVRNPWYYGWGIRLTPQGWLWNVSGLWAVELELTSGRRFRIGSDEAEALAEALRAAGAAPA
jgi:protein-S-isoprenylcysteine O-methyltransferase Ste14